MSRIGARFKKLHREGRKAFIPYIMAGYPTLDDTMKLIAMLEKEGADIIELGVPFSDPLADGPVIQRAAESAVAAGVTLRKVIALVREARKWSKVPIVLMTYYNPVFKYGLEAFVRDAVDAGVDGVIVPDLPPDEAGDLMKIAKPAGLDTIFLVAPTSTPDRRKIVAKAARGFIYYVSITGITGATLNMDKGIAESISALRELSGGKPVALGFGVSTPEEAAGVASMADGVIVGSAIVRRVSDPSLAEFVRSLRAAIR